MFRTGSPTVTNSLRPFTTSRISSAISPRKNTNQSHQNRLQIARKRENVNVLPVQCSNEEESILKLVDIVRNFMSSFSAHIQWCGTGLTLHYPAYYKSTSLCCLSQCVFCKEISLLCFVLLRKKKIDFSLAMYCTIQRVSFDRLSISFC